MFIYNIIHVIKCNFFLNRPVLGGGDEEGRQLAQDDHAGVDEDAAEHRQSQQAGWGSAAVQLLAGASSPHHNGQKSHQTNVQEQELQVSQVCLQLETRIRRVTCAEN